MSLSPTTNAILIAAVVLLAILLACVYAAYQREVKRNDENHLVVAMALNAWKWQADQGDGIDESVFDVFAAGCEHVGIAIAHDPDGERYTLTPTLPEVLGQAKREVGW
jgi:hypothetical protein